MPAKIYFPPEQQFDMTKSGDIDLDKVKSKKKVKQQSQGWVTKIGPLFKFMAFQTRYDIVKKYWMYPARTMMMWGHLFGGLLKKVPTMAKPIYYSIDAFYPKMSKKKKWKLVNSTTNYFATLFLNLMFRLPLTAFAPHQRMFHWKGQEYLDKAYERAKKKNTGVIVLVGHIGDILNVIPGFSTHPNNYTVASIANISNSPIYQYIINKPAFDNLYVYPSISFRRISKNLLQHLNRGDLLVIYQDYSNKRQLRVPMWPEKYPYLIHTSQSAQKLQRETGAEMIVCISEPTKGVLGRTTFRLLDNTKLMEVAEKYKNSADKEFHGRLSMEINKQLYKWIRKYAHCWEEITNFAMQRIADKVELEKNEYTLGEIIDICFVKMNQIIENSWEPERKDEKILERTKNFKKILRGKLTNKDLILKIPGKKLNLSKMTTRSEFETILKFLKDKLNESNNTKLIKIIEKSETELYSLFSANN